MSERQWSNGAATDYGIEQFTEGDCWVLAWAVHRRRRFPVIGLSEASSTRAFFHVVNRIAPGVYLDVEGLATRRQLRERWCSEDVKMHTNRLHWLEDHPTPDPDLWTFDHAVRRAYRMADHLIARYSL